MRAARRRAKVSDRGDLADLDRFDSLGAHMRDYSIAAGPWPNGAHPQATAQPTARSSLAPKLEPGCAMRQLCSSLEEVASFCSRITTGLPTVAR